MKQSGRRRPRGWLQRAFVTWLVTVVCILWSSGLATAAPRTLELSLKQAIPIQEQPFYEDLLIKAEQWSYAPLGQIRGNSPKQTLLNFYAAMANVGETTHSIAEQSQTDPGLIWSAPVRQTIDNTEALFENCIEALDTSGFPPSVRTVMAEEAAIELKHVLDYVFNNARSQIVIPDSEEMKNIIETRPSKNESWRLPGTTITLTTKQSEEDVESGVEYYFAESTVKNIRNKFMKIYDRSIKESKNEFTTPFFYSDYIYNPGYLVPPKWYLNLPEPILNFKNIRIGEQTIFQSVLAIGALIVYALIVFTLIRKVLNSYNRQNDNQTLQVNSDWADGVKAWKRFLLLLPILPLTDLLEIFVDEYVNLTGQLLFFKIYVNYVLWFTIAGVIAFYFFEAIGRTLTVVISHFGDRKSEVSVKRIGNLLMPSCRALGVLSAIALIYRSLIMLGLPASTVIAFSAVPGLAIGLGASKLLGNIFAGFSIQTDRPVRVGEFCKVGNTLGYVSKIGLRSMELQTPESKVSIPNAIAEETTVINYSRRHSNQDHEGQTISLEMDIATLTSSWQVDQIAKLTKKHLSAHPDLDDVLVSLERQPSTIYLLFFASTKAKTWDDFLEIRRTVIVRIQQLIAQVKHSRRVISVAFSTPPEKLDAIHHDVEHLISSDPQFSFDACELLKISDFSYDFVLTFIGEHTAHGAFLESVDRFNKALITRLREMEIVIPYPTQTEVQVQGPSSLA